MHALIVVAHHDPQSLTHAIAAQVAAGLEASGHTYEIAALAAELRDFCARLYRDDLTS